MRQLIRTYSITGLHEITITGYTFTKQDIRLILDETLASAATTDEQMLASVLVSSTKKANVISVVNGVITLASTTAILTVGDDLTIEIDIDNVASKKLEQFFGIAGSFEAEGVGHEQTDNTVINECKTRYAEVFGDLLPSDFVMPNSVTIDGTTYTGTVNL